MIYNAKESKLKLGNAQLDYITFGRGEKALVMIQGLNTRGIKGAAVSLAYMYRDLGHAAYEEAKDFNKRVFGFFMDENGER